MKTLKDLCLGCLGNNLHGNISSIVCSLATINKEILLERLVFHDRLTPEYLPHITYNLFSSLLRRINFYRCLQVTDGVLLQLSLSKCQLFHLTISDCSSVTDIGITHITRGQESLEFLKLRKLHSLTAKAFAVLHSPSLKTVKIQTCNGINTDAIQVLLKKNDVIEELALTSCKKLDDSVISVVAQYLGATLKVLNLRDLYTLSNNSLVQLANRCPLIISLNLHGCSRISDEGLNQIIEKCQHLKELDISYCTGLQRSPASACIAHLPLTLQELSLVGIMSDDSALLISALTRLTALKSLRLCGVPAVTDEALDEILCSIGPTLQKLDLSGGLMSPLTDSGIAAITKHCSILSFVGLSMLKQVTGTTFLPLLRDYNRACKLKVLQLSCPKLDPEVLYQVSTNCSALEDLALSGVQAVNDEFLIAIANLCPSLRELGIKACRQVTDVGVCALAQHCPLECIVLSGVHSLTNRSIYALANGCPYLREIYLSGCFHVSTDAIRYLVDACIPRVVFEHRIPNVEADRLIANNTSTGIQPHPTGAALNSAS